MSKTSPAGFTLIELLVVISIIGVVVGFSLPALQFARESGRRAECANHVKQIGLALQQYLEVHRKFPPGAVLKPQNYQTYKHYYDPWQEAAGTGPDDRGASWMLFILPYIELNSLYSSWNFSKSVRGNKTAAQTEIALFYCPTRRVGIRPGDEEIMFDNWTSGGTDYGGCLGGGNGWRNTYSPYYLGPPKISHEFLYGTTLFREKCIGIFAPNRAAAAADIIDGASKTIMTGELQRLHPLPGSTDYDKSNRTSNDGWATAGVATLFDTMFIDNGSFDSGAPGGMNNGFYESPGSSHPGGAHFGYADGSVHFIRENIDSNVFSCLGSMADQQMIQPPD